MGKLPNGFSDFRRGLETSRCRILSELTQAEDITFFTCGGEHRGISHLGWNETFAALVRKLTSHHIGYKAKEKESFMSIGLTDRAHIMVAGAMLGKTVYIPLPTITNYQVLLSSLYESIRVYPEKAGQ
ncbi:hypothetical protein SAMN04488542_108122 [Fontibacillus panacisegetis]|uniref:Uncharacterized protein n=1 Tax=Fontibacillus panacisegetis TaxID=670482 RepID=A0A1G7JWR8_9BACL|nr:hypothetical protein [Fontibacillus panacisegetis]SDF28969.1 hypothetical protein SAMN04488542_108122 [Fontibacillus panacisegetis]